MASMFTYLDRAAEEQLSLLRQLVNIDSGTDDKAGVDQVGAVLQPLLEELGLVVESIRQTTVGDHLIGRKAGNGGPELLVVGHMDTVFSKGTVAERPFRVEGERAYGPGILDMKGGLVVALFALRALRAESKAAWDRMGIRVILNSDEETGSDTSRDLIAQEAIHADLACVLEPARAGGEYVRSRKGVGMFRLTVTGRSSHAGAQPELGANAVVELAHKMVALHSLNDYAAGLTVNCGVITGGTRSNVVPDGAQCDIDVRVPAVAQMEAVTQRLQEIAATSTIAGTSAELTGSFKHEPMEYSAKAEQLYGLLGQAAAEVGYQVRTVATGGGSDGNNTSRYTTTLDGMGPRGNHAHNPGEYVEISSLPERTKGLARFWELWAEEGRG